MLAGREHRVVLFISEKKVKRGCWINGSGWNHDLYQVRNDLVDMISTEHPIKLLRMCYHICVVN